MRWSWKIATVAGIPVRIHVTFLLFIVWLFWASAAGGGGFARAAQDVGFILAAFACVVLHEFGHALTGRRFGVITRDITLLPIGGVARLERIPRHPRQEVAIALAGPLVNVAIAGALLLFMQISPGKYVIGDPTVLERSFAARLFLFNVVVTLFNLIPAFPMDGGRVLRALLAMRLDYVRATRVAANVGQGIALLFGLLGLLGNPMLILIALFVFIAAGQESAFVQMRSVFDGIPVSRAMIKDFHALRSGDPISRAVELLLTGHQQDFPVLGDSERDPTIGILARSDLLKALANGRTDTKVGDVARRDCGMARPGEMLEDVFQKMQESGCPAVPVVEPGRGIVGMVTLENVGEFAMVHAALDRGERIGPL